MAAFWRAWVAEANPCTFPILADAARAGEGIAKSPIEFSEYLEQQIAQFRARGDDIAGHLFAVAWSLVLRTYTGSGAVSFGFESGEGEKTKRLCSVSIEAEANITTLLQGLRDDLNRTQSFQVSKFSDIPSFRESESRAFCNTALRHRGGGTPQADADLDFDIVIQIDALGGKLQASMTYSELRFEKSQAQGIAATFQQILSELLKGDVKSVADINLMHPTTKQRIFEWNANYPAPVDKVVDELFQIQVNARPQSMAVHSSDDSFSYEELDVLSTKLASHLRSKGVGPEIIVLLSFPKSAWAVVGMIAVIKAGGTMLFFDASHPKARLEEIQSQVKSNIMLTAPQYADLWEWTGADVFVVDRTSLDTLPITIFTPSGVKPNNMLYIIYTSGSTGKPKGCVIEHKQFLTGSLAQQNESGLTYTDRVLQLASFTFDVSILEIITSLISGACVCIPGDAHRAKGPAHCIQEFGITWAFLTPSLSKLMAPEMVPNLRFLVLGGEPLTRENVEIWSPHLQLANGYGPTECSIAATGNKRLTPKTDPANIGYPLGGLCWICDPDDHRRLVPPGAPGELIIHGPIVARGYFQDPAKTDAVFVDDFPWLPEQGFGDSRRMYKSGDLARFNSDGTINFISRKDNQVKLRGLRIELGEIEENLAVSYLIRQVVVILPRQGPCKNQLTAVLSLKQLPDDESASVELSDLFTDSQVTEAVAIISEDLSKRIPAYMMPSVWAVVKSIPLTVSGKQNRVMVSKWTVEMDDNTYSIITGGTDEEESPEPANAVEAQIQELCSTVLEIPKKKVYLNRSFVNNSGDSLSGMQLMAKLRQAGIKVSIQDMIQSKTLTELAERASTSAEPEMVAHEPAYDRSAFDSQILPHLGLDKEDIEEVYPLGPMQRGIVLSQSKGAANYELRIVCEINSTKGPVDVGRLQAAWEAVVARHTSLRTIFVASISEDAPADQVVLKSPTCYTSVVQCRDRADVSKTIRRHRIIASPKQPQANFIVYETPTKTYCMADINHALIDGVSVLILFRDLSAAYSGLLPTKPLRYSQYVGYFQQQDRQPSLSYWKDYLSNMTPCHFPQLNDEKRDPSELRELSTKFDGAAILQDFCRKHNFTPASVIQTAWAIVLKAYTGTDDVAFGFLSAGRDLPIRDIEDTVGAYINMLICRLQFRDSHDVKTLIGCVQDSFLNSMPHQLCSLGEIQHVLGIKEALFNTILSLQSAVGETIKATGKEDGIAFQIVDEVDPQEYMLSLNVAISRESVYLNLRHYSGYVGDFMANNIFETFKHILTTMLGNADYPLTELQLLSANDLQILQNWSHDWKDQRTCVHTEISKQVQIRPDQNAIEAWDGTLTYRELDQLATRLAKHLGTVGVGPEVLVPLSFKKSMWYPVSQLAVLKAGGGCVPFDPAHPRGRREEMLRKCDARLAVTSPAARPLFEGLVDTIVVVDESLLATLAGKEDQLPDPTPASPDNPAFVVFTSGSTGKYLHTEYCVPKGTVLEHHSYCSAALAHIGPISNYNPSARILQFASYTFDVSIAETFSGLISGATICIPQEEERLNDLAGVINRMDATNVFLTPSVCSTLHPSEVPSINTLHLGGELVRRENVTDWADTVHVTNTYGPSECCVWSTILSPVPMNASTKNIGTGVGCTAWIADPDDWNKLVAIGCVGEILVHGPIVGRGYLKEKEKTEAAFIKDPAWLQSDKFVGNRRLYRSGDLGFYRSDGSINIVGRRDFQIKLHGQRIELGEIELGILRHDLIENGVVLFPKAGKAKERIVAVITLNEFTEPMGSDIKLLEATHNEKASTQLAIVRSALSEKVPGYMMPTHWLIVEALPHNANNKTDRARVKKWVEELEFVQDQTSESSGTEGVVVAPTTKAEENLRSVISAVLGLAPETISMDRNWVGLGGDSITGMQVSGKCRSSGMLVTVKDVLTSKNIRHLASLAKIIDQNAALTSSIRDSGAFSLLSGSHPDLLDREAKKIGLKGLGDLEDGYPCSPMQQGILISQAQFAGHYKVEVICEVVASQGGSPPSVDRLKTAWQRVVDRHAILRTVFLESASKGGLFDQFVIKKVSPRVEVAGSYDALITYPETHPLDYEDHVPPHRLTLCEADGKIFFNLEMSHTLIDGGSMPVVLKDIVEAYEHSLEPGPKYRDLISILQQRDSEESLGYWKTYLNGAEPCTFPKMSEKAVGTNALETVNVTIPEPLVRRIQDFARENSVTLANVLQVAWALVLRAYTSQPDVLFGFLASGRDVAVENVDEAVGPFINMLVCRVDTNNSPTIIDLIKKMQNDFLDSLPHQHTSLAELQHILDHNTSRMFNSAMSLQRPMAEGIEVGSEISINYLRGADPTEYDLSINITASDKLIDVAISYWTTFLTQSQGDQLATTFSHILSQMLEHSQSPLSDISLLSSQDTEKIFKWNHDGVAPTKISKLIHEVVAQRALEQPNSPAVESWDLSLTYEELEAKAIPLAQYLRKLGVKPESIVPLLFDKSAWTMVAMLAILRCGGAYCSMSPEHPTQHHASIVRETGAQLVLTGSSKYAEKLQHVVDEVVVVDASLLDKLPKSTASIDSGVTPDNVAFICTTSGSTGKPKLICELHSGWASNLAHNPDIGLKSTSRVFQFAAYIFDTSNSEIWGALMSGGCICIPSENERIDDPAGAMNRLKVNWTFFTPSMASLINPEDVPRLEVLALGGEQVREDIVNTWKDYARVVNSYGPAECSVWTSMCELGHGNSPASIGKGNGSILWIADASDVHRLAPIGTIGELLIEGPIQARGYLDPEKTAQAFIPAPKWRRDDKARLYRSGDLVRYSEDGTLVCVGRKDGQIKLNGQRIEMGEIERTIASNDLIQYAVCLFPKKGICRRKLVAFVAPSGAITKTAASEEPRIISEKSKKQQATTDVAHVKEQLRAQVPEYMVPSVWLMVETIPLTASKKVDRVKVARWVEELSNDVYSQALDIVEEAYSSENATAQELLLQRVIGSVLNLPVEQVALNKSYVQNGGDSILAMQLVVQCRKEGVKLTVKDVMRSKSISALALTAQATDTGSFSQEELLDVPFKLSPIQSMYFSEITHGSTKPEANQYNQSFLLVVEQAKSVEDFAEAIDQVVQYHGMLRARYAQDTQGNWSQMILAKVPGSYRFRPHRVATKDEALAIAEKSQEELDIEKGPVFAAEVFDIANDKQLLFMCAHHLVIDMVSWRTIISQVEQLMTTSEPLPSLKPLPFHSWIKMQAEFASKNLDPESSLPHHIPGADYGYWGMKDQPNLRGEVEELDLSLSKEETTLVLRGCHESMKTEPVDLFLAALFHSFVQTFRRSPPAIFNEGHGREPWDPQIDITETVGWFTTMFPFHVPAESSRNVLDTVRQIKDQKKKLPRNGWSYFNSRLSNEAGKAAFANHSPAEIVFNYLGVFQGQEQSSGLLRPVPFNKGDVGPHVRRFSLFEVNAYVIDGSARFAIAFNRNMKRLSDIRAWFSSYKAALLGMAHSLQNAPRTWTLGDFPLLPTTFDTLSKFQVEHLPRLISNIDEIEDIYACSPMQEGILLSQNRSPGAYQIQTIAEILSDSQHVIDVEKVKEAWQQVVDRHPMLRTIFVQRLSDRPYDQVVLKNYASRLQVIEDTDANAVNRLREADELVYAANLPAHQVTVVKTDTGRIFVKLEISHALTDGAAMGILIQEIALAYLGQLPQMTGPLYSDYIAYIQSQPNQKALGYWKTTLAGVRPCHLPALIDNEISPQKHLRSLNIKVPEAALVRDFCRQHNITLASIFRLAWGLVLRAYTGDDQVCFGYLASGREVPVAGIESAVGAFINMLVCSLDFGVIGQKKAVDTLEDLQDEYLKSLPWQHTSLAEIQHELGLSGQSLFNTVLSFQRRSFGDFQVGEIMFRYLDGVDPTEYDANLSVSDTEAGIHVHMSYFTTRLSEGQAANVANSLSTTLASILATPQSKVGSLSLVGARDMEQIAKWNANCPPLVDRCVHEIFHENACRTPDAPAIASFDGDFTYAELDMKTTQLAQQLLKLGVRVNQLIPVCFEKSAWALVAMLAIMKAGAGYVPLDPAHPDDRLETIITQTGSSLVLASNHYASRMRGLVKDIYVVQEASKIWDDDSPEIKTTVKPGDAAYALFTSGSTGLPKGVVLPHSAVSSSITHHGAVIKCSPTTRMYQFAAYTFDACVLEIYTTLAYGGCICVPSDNERMSDIAGFITRMRVNTSFMTPSLVRILSPEQIPTMQTLILGGEALGQDNINTWAGKLRLMNGYGPTETCVFCVMKTFNSPKDRNDILGYAVSSLSWIVQPHDLSKLAPVGSVGMLMIQGPTLARGYLNDKVKTDAVFLDDPGFLPEVSGTVNRVYNTGDRARYNSDGSVTYLGRVDTQVKLRGQRIELAEIEHHSKANFPQAAQVGVEVVVPQGQKERATLAAFLCLADQPKDAAMFLPLTAELKKDVTELQKTLTALLPPYEIPSLYIPVGRMPTTTAGKLDRKTLRDGVGKLSDDEIKEFSLSEGSKRPLTTETEKILAALWHEVLKIPVSQIGADDNFLICGGDSLSAMRLAAKSTSGISLSVSDIFRHPVLSDMAALAQKSIDNILSPVNCAIEQFELIRPLASPKDVRRDLAARCEVSEKAIEDAYPCTPLQEGLMVLSILNPGAYISQKAFKLPSSMDLQKFRKAWEMAATSNPILRTVIVQTNSAQALQVVLNQPLHWRSAKTLEEYLKQDKAEDFSYGKLLSRYAITEDRHFVWTAHHSMYDGWSVPLILEQVQSYYLQGHASPAPGFNKFIEYLLTTSPEACEEFWKGYLSGEKPVSFPEPPSASHKLTVDRAAHHSLLISRKTGSEIPMATVLRAAWAFVLSQYADSKDALFGVTLSGRNCPVKEVDKMLGPTITTVPVRVSVPEDMTVASFLRAVQSQSTEMIPFEHYGLQNISRASPEAARAVEFQNLFVVQPMSQFSVHNNAVLGAEEVPMQFENFDTYPLIMECSLTDDQVDFEARFDNAIISADRVQRMLYHFEHIIKQLNGASKTTKLSDIRMFGERDLTQILKWNAKYPEVVDTSIPEVFAQQVKERPDALAVDAWDGKFTYAELDKLSTHFARHLVDRGVGPEVLVPLCFEKSRWAILTQMSVVKAGGAVVNMDPAHPLTRLELIIQDARAKLLLVAPQLYDKFAEGGIETLAIDEDFFMDLIKKTPKTQQLPKIQPSSTAYVLFTSGSTGRPKGIVIEHGSLCSSSKAHGTAWDIGPNTRLLQFAAYTFDVSCADIFTTLQRGGCICVPSEHGRLNNLAGAINKFQANWMFVTPTIASLLPAHGIPSLKKLVLGGEASTRDTIAKWHNVLDLIVCYGPAETSVYSHGAPPATADSDPADLGDPIGVLNWICSPDDYNKLMPIGVTGELLLEGRNVARGYLHDKEKTAAAFVSNPIWAKGGTADKPRRFYRTGDLVRWNEDGTIHFVGRKDLQVKIRGQRVELGEIEHAIRNTMPELGHVTVDAVRQANQGNRQAVVAFLHRTTEGGPAKATKMDDAMRAKMVALQRALTESLPSYMIPALFIPMEHVPLTMNGKSNRKELRDLASALTREEALEYGLEDAKKQEPTTEMEFKLRDLWARILGVDPSSIGTGDHWVRAGGDSILAMKLVGAAAEQSIGMSVKDLFRNPILADLAKSLDGKSEVTTNGHTVYEPFSLITSTTPNKLVPKLAAEIGTSKDNIADIFPATDFQQNAVAHALLQTRGFRNYLWLDGTGDKPLDIKFAKKAIEMVIEEHEMLRTIFALHQNQIVQVVLKNANIEIDVHETSKDISPFTHTVCRTDMEQATKLTDPLVKFILISNGSHHRIIMRISHAQYDGLCLPLIWQSLANAFQGRPPPSTLSHSAYISGLSRLDKADQLSYWTSLLNGSSMTNTVSKAKPTYHNIYNAYHTRTLPAGLSLSSSGITFATILKGAWSLVLSSLSSTPDVVFGHVVNGRSLDIPGVEKVVGACINIVPVRAQLSSSTTFLDLLNTLQSQHAESMPYEAVGSRTIVRECTSWPKYSRFSSIIQHQNIDEESGLSFNGTEYKIDFFCPEADEADMAIKTTPQKDGTTEVLMLCSDKTIHKQTADVIINSVCEAITTIVKDPTQQVGTFNPKSKPSFPLPDSSQTTSGSNAHINGSAADANGSAQPASHAHSIKSRISAWEGIDKKMSLYAAVKKSWQEVLSLPHDTEISEETDFFSEMIGGDLVAVAVLACQWERQQGKRVAVEDLIDSSTLEGMTGVLSRI